MGVALIANSATMAERIPIENSALDEIKQNLTRPETGGILGVDGRGVVTKFYPDVTGTATKTQ